MPDMYLTFAGSPWGWRKRVGLGKSHYWPSPAETSLCQKKYRYRADDTPQPVKDDDPQNCRDCQRRVAILRRKRGKQKGGKT